MLITKKISEIPAGVRLISWATSIRYIGWGLVEAVIPIFLYSFTKNYTGAGFLSAIYDIIFILFLPLAGMLADITASKKIIIAGLILYPFIGLSYFMAGITSMVIFVVLARAINGVAFAFDSAGRATYFRRHSSFKNASTVFGYFETLSNLWWIGAMILSLWALKYFKIHVLFLMLIPTVLIAIFLISKLNSDKNEGMRKSFKKVFSFNYFGDITKEIRQWDEGLRLITVIIFLLTFVEAIINFIIPIYVYSHGASIQYAVAISILFAIPSLFGFPLGKFLDKKRDWGIGLGFFLIAILLLAFPFVTSQPIQLTIFLVLGIAFQMIILGFDGATTIIAKSKEYGIVSGIMSAISDSGNVVGMLFLGFLVDKGGMNYGIIGSLTITTLCFFILVRNRGYLKNAMPVKLEREFN